MKRTPLNLNLVSGFLVMAMVSGLLFSSTARAAVDSPLDLATIPLSNSPTISIQPNLLFIMDDSGSMAWDYMPDWANSGTDSLFRNASYNTVAYNPEIHYVPPAYFTSSGLNVTTYPSQTGMTTETGASSASKPNWRQVKDNPYRSTATSNIETEAAYYHIVAGEYCTLRDLKVCVAQSAKTDSHPYPAPVRWCNSSTNANSATPAANSCQATRLTGFTNLRAPTQRTATIRIDNSNSCTSVNGIVVGSQQIMASSITCSSTESTTASRIENQINACTYNLSGNCTVVGYRATRSSATLTIYAPTAITGTPNAPTSSGSLTTTRTAFAKNNVPGERLFVPITPGVDAYPLAGSSAKALARTDCAGTTCTYVEEMTNYANWWAYYHTREQTMKTSASLAFKGVGDDFRVGFMTTSTRAAYMLNFATFNTAHKAAWYESLFKSPADRSTPLRGALSKAGRIYAAIPGDTAATRGVFSDPMEYECQQNFTLLTTDGFWNTGDETSTYAGGPLGLDGNNVGNMDSKAAGTPRPLLEGETPRADTLADVAKYYFDKDLRTLELNNCPGALDASVCQSPGNDDDTSKAQNVKQKMVTMTLGMGVDGTLAYTTDYKTDKDGDYAGLKGGSKNWPDPIDNTTAERIDDLWHAAVNGGGTYFSAKNPTDLVNQLKDALASVAVKVGAGAAAATSTLNPVAGDKSGYVASYTTGLWTGNLEKREIITSGTNAGAFSTKADKCVEDILPTADCTSPSSIKSDVDGNYYCETPDITSAEACGSVENWDGENSLCKVPVPADCTGTLKSKVGDKSDDRKILMKKADGSLGDFLYENLSSSQRTTFESDFLAANLSQWSYLAQTLTADDLAKVAGENLLKYIRGQKGYEETAGDAAERFYRKRQAVLGDIVDSTPKYIGRPTFSYTDPGYAEFKSTHDSRSGTVYVGGNDGMLHAFDGSTLEERWAYVPSMVIPNLWKLADTAYSTKHTYYANGAPTISDVWDGSTWRTILVAGLNGGGRGYYALDITNPTSPTMLWEFDASNGNEITKGDPNLGFTYGNPVVTKNPDGKWVVLVTSGYNNIPDDSPFYDDEGVKFKPNNPPQFTTGDGKGYLFVLDAVTGVKLAAISTEVGTQSAPSGLARISAWADEPEVNNTATYVYGGDLLGNLWRFDISDNTVMKLASFGSSQPITTAPELGQIREKRIVFVGTGKYLEVSDLTNTDQQTLYAIKDDDMASTLSDPKSNLVEQTVGNAVGDNRFSPTNGNDVNWDAGLGWYVDFPDTGERQNVASKLVLGTLLVPTTVPKSSVCQPSGYGWLNFFDYKTGRAVPDAEGMVSTKTDAPIVGFNVVSIGGKPKVNIVQADNPNPKLIDFIKFTGSGTGFQKTRAIWRELLVK